MADRLLEERADRVAWLTVNRPEVRNALSLELCELMTGAQRKSEAISPFT